MTYRATNKAKKYGRNKRSLKKSAYDYKMQNHLH